MAWGGWRACVNEAWANCVRYQRRERRLGYGCLSLSRDTNLYKDLPKETKILHSHISVEYRTCILQLKFKPGDNITHFYERPVPEHFGLFRKKQKLTAWWRWSTSVLQQGQQGRKLRTIAPDFGESLKLERWDSVPINRCSPDSDSPELPLVNTITMCGKFETPHSRVRITGFFSGTKCIGLVLFLGLDFLVWWPAYSWCADHQVRSKRRSRLWIGDVYHQVLLTIVYMELCISSLTKKKKNQLSMLIKKQIVLTIWSQVYRCNCYYHGWISSGLSFWKWWWWH